MVWKLLKYVSLTDDGTRSLSRATEDETLMYGSSAEEVVWRHTNYQLKGLFFVVIQKKDWQQDRKSRKSPLKRTQTAPFTGKPRDQFENPGSQKTEASESEPKLSSSIVVRQP